MRTTFMRIVLNQLDPAGAVPVKCTPMPFVG